VLLEYIYSYIDFGNSYLWIAVMVVLMVVVLLMFSVPVFSWVIEKARLESYPTHRHADNGPEINNMIRYDLISGLPLSEWTAKITFPYFDGRIVVLDVNSGTVAGIKYRGLKPDKGRLREVLAGLERLRLLLRLQVSDGSVFSIRPMEWLEFIGQVKADDIRFMSGQSMSCARVSHPDIPPEMDIIERASWRPSVLRLADNQDVLAFPVVDIEGSQDDVASLDDIPCGDSDSPEYDRITIVIEEDSGLRTHDTFISPGDGYYESLALVEVA
jgi:hypothetical protein